MHTLTLTFSDSFADTAGLFHAYCNIIKLFSPAHSTCVRWVDADSAAAMHDPSVLHKRPLQHSSSFLNASLCVCVWSGCTMWPSHCCRRGCDLQCLKVVVLDLKGGSGCSVVVSHMPGVITTRVGTSPSRGKCVGTAAWNYWLCMGKIGFWESWCVLVLTTDLYSGRGSNRLL